MKSLLPCMFFSMIIMPFITKPFIVIGHRGAAGYEPENTLRSFKRAIDMGVHMIELDVHICASGEIVVMHDKTIDRTTNGKGNIQDLSWNILKKYDAGKGEHIPLLSEVLDLVNKRVMVNIELKDPKAAQPVAALINQYVRNKGWSYDNFIIASFDHYVVKNFSKYSPLVKTAVLFEGNPIGYADIAKRANAQYAIMYYESITKEFIENAHEQGIKVFAYTINSKPIAAALQKISIDGIITDYPDMFIDNVKKDTLA